MEGHHESPLVEGYGLTEASPVVTCNRLDGSHRIGTIGIPVPSTLVKVVDDNGKKVAFGTPGNLLVKGPQVIKESGNSLQRQPRSFLTVGFKQTI